MKNYPANRTSRLRNDIINDNIMNYRFKNGNVIQRHKRQVCDFVASRKSESEPLSSRLLHASEL